MWVNIDLNIEDNVICFENSNFGRSLLLTEKSRGSWKYKLYHKTNKLPHKTDFKLLHKPSKYILIDNYIFTKLQPVSILAVQKKENLQLAKTSKKLELLFFNTYLFYLVIVENF